MQNKWKSLHDSIFIFYFLGIGWVSYIGLYPLWRDFTFISPFNLILIILWKKTNICQVPPYATLHIQHFTWIISLTLTIITWNSYYQSHFLEENTKNKRSSPRSYAHNEKDQAALETGLPNFQSLCSCSYTMLLQHHKGGNSQRLRWTRLLR